jgi:prepilin-type N-terminal cleavage/methylation domain-containing protein
MRESQSTHGKARVKAERDNFSVSPERKSGTTVPRPSTVFFPRRQGGALHWQAMRLTFARFQRRPRGFTLIELLLVMAILGVLAGVVLVAINPSRQLALARNRERHNDIKSILDGIYQYQIDTNNLPAGIPTVTARDICKDTAASCNNGVNLSVLTQNGVYLVRIPADPQASLTGTGTNYSILTDTDRRITITAPLAEEGEAVSVRR